MRTLTTCNDTYTRDAHGVWRYPWGQPVPDAVDLTLADRMSIDATVGRTEGIEVLRPLTMAERHWLAGRSTSVDQVLVRQRPGHRPHAGDLIVGMSAPELHAQALLTVVDVAQAAGMSQSTIDSARNSGSRAGHRAPRHRVDRMTATTVPTSRNQARTRISITLAGVFLASLIGTFALWATIEPDCSRSEIVAFEAACAGATTTP